MAHAQLDPALEQLAPTTTSTTATSPAIKKSKINDTPKPEGKKKNPNWSIEEDKQLCVAWLNTTRDNIVGIGQKAATFWERVHKYYMELIDDLNSENKNNKKFKQLPVRLVNAVECQWGHILKVCNRFGGIYAQVERRLKSGRTRDDILAEAKELYKVTHESAFNLDHCWGILKDTPKWQATQQEHELKSKKSKTPKETSQDTNREPSSMLATEDMSQSSPQPQEDLPTDDDEDKPHRAVLGSDSRPEGQKTAKRKRAEDQVLERVLRTQEELVKISKERMCSVKAAMEAASDERTMAMDLSGMDEESRLYWQKKKRAILDRQE